MPAPSATDHNDTIAAISTPPGEGGVGIVRISGPRAIDIAVRLFRSSHGRDLLDDPRPVFHGHVVDEEGRPLDEALLHRMRAPHSYTREDVVEINGHGGAGPLNAILEEALRHGARLAGPGEFTRRAFLNGRIDLVQAEAVIDQVRARTRAGLQAANAAAGGALSRAIHAMADRLRDALARVEAAVDFPEDDLPELVDAALLDALRDTHREMLGLLDTAEAGRLLREGVAVAIVGRPNVGKSSLFNALLRDVRAIVTAHAGTTRDRLEEYITLAGVPVRLIDTAGLRDTADEVEAIGVAQARQALRGANLALAVLDADAGLTADDQALLTEIEALDLPLLRVWNKVDLAPPPEDETEAVAISATTGAGLDALEQRVATLLLGGLQAAAGGAMLTRLHQKESLRRAADSLARLLENAGLSPEFLAADLQEALHALGEITGETTPDDILERVFSSFCIGK